MTWNNQNPFPNFGQPPQQQSAGGQPTQQQQPTQMPAQAPQQGIPGWPFPQTTQPIQIPQQPAQVPPQQNQLVWPGTQQQPPSGQQAAPPMQQQTQGWPGQAPAQLPSGQQQPQMPPPQQGAQPPSQQQQDPLHHAIGAMQSAIIEKAQKAGLTDSNLLKLIDFSKIGISQSGHVFGVDEQLGILRQSYPGYFQAQQGNPGQSGPPGMAGGAPVGSQNPVLQMTERDQTFFKNFGWEAMGNQFQLGGPGTRVYSYQELMMGNVMNLPPMSGK